MPPPHAPHHMASSTCPVHITRRPIPKQHSSDDYKPPPISILNIPTFPFICTHMVLHPQQTFSLLGVYPSTSTRSTSRLHFVKVSSLGVLLRQGLSISLIFKGICSNLIFTEIIRAIEWAPTFYQTLPCLAQQCKCSSELKGFRMVTAHPPVRDGCPRLSTSTIS